MATIKNFDCGKFGKGRPRDEKYWKIVQQLILELLIAAGLPDKDYKVRVQRKCRERVAPREVQYKINRCAHGKVHITVYPVNCGNNFVFEYSVVGVYDQWDAMEACKALCLYVRGQAYDEDIDIEALADEADATEDDVAEKAVTAKTPATSKPRTIVERIAELEKTATRNDEREKKVKQLAEKARQVERQIAEWETSLQLIENDQIKLLEEIENDHECVAAKESLAALEKLLG